MAATSFTVAFPSAGYKHGRAVQGAHRREVLERHLRRAVLADRDAGVRAAEPEVRPADRSHPHEVGGAREERAERGGERRLAERLHADLRAHHRLLRDVDLEEALGGDPLELVRVGGVPDLAVQHHDVGAVAGEPGERVAERLARRDRAVVDGRLAHVPRPQLDRDERLGLRRGDREVPFSAELLDRRDGLFLGERLAVPSLGVRQERHPVALLGAGDDQRRPVGAPRPPCTRRRSRRRRGRRSRSRAIRTPPPGRGTRRRSTRASWGRAGRAG